jgi:hypothetical protein
VLNRHSVGITRWIVHGFTQTIAWLASFRSPPCSTSWTHAEPLGAFWVGLGRQGGHEDRGQRDFRARNEHGGPIEGTRRVGKDRRLSRATGSPLWLLGQCLNRHLPTVPLPWPIGMGTLGQGSDAAVGLRRCHVPAIQALVDGLAM